MEVTNKKHKSHHYYRWAMRIVGFLLLLSTGIVSAARVVVTGDILDVKVDVETCGAGYTWCVEASPTGMNEGIATVGNFSPVLLVIQIVNPKNVPVTGLTINDFSVSHIVSPQGIAPAIPDPVVCPSCFRDHGNGVYRLAVQSNILGRARIRR